MRGKPAVRVDIVNSIIASPLNDWNKPWVCIGSPIKETGRYLFIFEGRIVSERFSG
jgi:hypothetical protein